MIHTFATKCRAREVRRFVVGGLLDGGWCHDGQHGKIAITTRSLAPTDPTKHGFIELYDMKYKMMTMLQRDVADQMGIPPEVKR